MTDRLAIEFISVFGMPPVEFIELAARLECPAIGLAPAPIVALPDLYPAWNLIADAALLRETKAALAASGVRIAQFEGLLLMPGRDAASQVAILDLAAELGAGQANACCLHPEMAANRDAFAELADLAAARGLAVTVEYLPGMGVGTLAAADALVRDAARPNAGVLVDAMHFYRSGSQTGELAGIDPARIRYAQICDVPLVSAGGDYADEARYERGAPGEGELPLADFVRALPPTCTIGLEVPMRARTLAGMSAFDRLRPAIAATRALLAATG